MWIDCNDRMPPPCVEVIAWFPNGGYSVHACHNEGEWRATLGRFHLDFHEREITHWQPFNPPEPKGPMDTSLRFEHGLMLEWKDRATKAEARVVELERVQENARRALQKHQHYVTEDAFCDLSNALKFVDVQEPTAATSGSNERLGAEPEWLFGVSPCGCVTAALADVRCAALVEDFEEEMERSGRKAEYMPKSIGMGALKKTCTHARA